jgi:Xaa-Pro aminopeptidase
MMDYNARIERFQQHLGENGISLAFLPVSTDLEYLVGVPRDIPNFGVTLHPGAWLEGAWLTPTHAPVLTLPRMTAEFGGLGRLTNVEIRVLGDWDDPVGLVSDILKRFNLSAQPRVAVSDRAEGETIIHLQELIPDAVFVSATQILRKQRTIKGADEIEAMRRAGAVTEAAFKDVLAQLKFGMTELEIVSEVDYQLRKHGSLGPSFTTSLYNSGKKHPLLFGDRLNTWKRPVKAGVSVLFDFGAVLDGWCYDFGRTVSFGEPSKEQIIVFNLVMDSQHAGMRALKAGNTCEAADAVARAVIADAGYGDFFRHRLGHGIGMDVHEPPFLTKGDQTVFVAGMMFTVEPSITQNNNSSARVEDVVVVHSDGGEPLTSGFQHLYVVE